MKVELYQFIEQQLIQKINYLQNLIDDLRTSNNDTKSSMGDKYETSREMMQQEIVRIQNQLNEILIQQELFSKIKPIDSEMVTLGSYIETSLGNFCIACSFGEIVFNNKKVFVLSKETPLAKILMGNKRNDIFEMNGKRYEIKLIN